MRANDTRFPRVYAFLGSVSYTLALIKHHPYPIVVSLWAGIIFAERLATDQVVYGLKRNLRESTLSTATVFCFLIISILVLIAMLVDRKSVAQGIDRLLEFLKTVIKQIFSPLPLFLLSFILFFMFLAQGALIGEQFQDTIGRWVIAVRDLLSELFSPPVIVLVGVVALTSAIWLVIHSFLRTKIRTIEEAIHETIVSSYFVVGAVGFYLWLYYVVIFPRWEEPIRLFAVTGFLKDTLVYTALTLVLVVGTYKAGETLRALKEDFHRWLVFGILGVGTALFTLVALILELNFKDNILLQGKSPEYPLEFQQTIVAFHIMFRAFGLIIPFLFLVFLRFLREVERVNLELRQVNT